MKNKKGQSEVFAYVLVLTTIILLFLLVVSIIFYNTISLTKDAFGSTRLSPPLFPDEISKETGTTTIKTYIIKNLIWDFQKLFIIFLILAIILLTKRIKKLNKEKRKK